MTEPDKTEFVPDYEIECCNCEQTPTVTIFQDGLIWAQSELCGPCYFGTAEALDPDNWRSHVSKCDPALQENPVH